MKRLLFTFNHEIIIFDVHDKTIVYRDRKWPTGVRFIPKDQNLVKMIIFSRNKISQQLINWIQEANTGTSLAEWTACKDDDEVAQVIKRDAKLRGCVFRREFSDQELRDAMNSPDTLIDKVPIDLPNRDVMSEDSLNDDSMESVEQDQ